MNARRLSVLAIAVTALAAGCSHRETGVATPPKAFCEAAAKYDDRVAKAGLDEQTRLVERLAATAPRAIENDAATFLDAMRRVKTDTSVVDSKRVKDAVERVNRYASTGCGLLKQQRGGPPF